MKTLTIIGGGPAALMLAAELDTEKYRVTLCEKKLALGRKFLVAGEGGLNLTYQAPVEELIEKYVPGYFMAPHIRQFRNTDLIKWLEAHGIPTFIGSSNRVFPSLDMKPIEVLNKIVEYVSSKDIDIRLNTTWMGWNDAGRICLEKSGAMESDIVVFALGGSSWKVTGSDGAWRSKFIARGVEVPAFRAANCAFQVHWQQAFIEAHAGKPLKNVALKFRDNISAGELVVTEFGLEGNAIYALSQQIQDGLLQDEQVLLHLDMKPTMTVEQIRTKILGSKETKTTAILQKDLHLDRTSIALLKQYTDKDTFSQPEKLAESIKTVPIFVGKADVLDNAISTLGGIALAEIDAHFQCIKIPNTYVIGEMLDWYAPTGGYLLQGCFSMGYALAKHLNALPDKV